MGLQQMLMKVAPRFMVKWVAAPYIAGETAVDALEVADSMWQQHRIATTIDLLGEYITSRAGVDREVAEYHRLLPQLAERPYCYPSVKLSALGQSVDEDVCAANAEDIVQRARDIGQFITFDMEDHTTVDSTLGHYRRLREKGYENVGIVLQSRLHRTLDDIAKLRDLRPVARICIGIYQEPPAVALTDKAEMKARLLECLAAMIDGGFYCNIATHDEDVIGKARRMIESAGHPRERCEFQMLLGVPRAKLQHDLVAAGYTVRLYVPFGVQWYAYSMRRLEENPDIFGAVLRNTFTRNRRLKR